METTISRRTIYLERKLDQPCADNAGSRPSSALKAAMPDYREVAA